MNKLLLEEKIYSVCEHGIVKLNGNIIGSLHIGKNGDGLEPSVHFKSIDAKGMWEITAFQSPKEIIRAINMILHLDYDKECVFDFPFDTRLTNYPEKFTIYQNQFNQRIFELKAEEIMLHLAV